ncbi:hypothetical protein EV421DRAFT_1660557, partial [Armillaria borealis]
SPQPSDLTLYKRLKTIGRGACGAVSKGIHIPTTFDFLLATTSVIRQTVTSLTGNVVALKIIDLDTADDDVGDIQREVALLSQLCD